MIKKKWVLAAITEEGSMSFVTQQGYGSAEILKAELHDNQFFPNPKHAQGFRPLMIMIAPDGERFIPL